MSILAEDLGDLVTVLEFLNSFSSLFDVEEELGGNVTLGKRHRLCRFVASLCVAQKLSLSV